MTADFSTVSFIGLGLIGGSLARLVRQTFPETVIWAGDLPAVLDEAVDDGTIDGRLQGIDDPRLHQSDLVILGTHLEESFEILKALVETATKPLAILDLGSTKGSICALAESLSQQFQFIGGHPLAGREVSGFCNSRGELFVGRRFLLTPCAKTDEAFKNHLITWLEELQMVPVVLDAARHDKLMSLVSHFPQFYAVALGNLLAANTPSEALHFLGGGIDDQMRLMTSPYEMWGDIFKDNKRNLNRVLTQFIGILQEMQQALDDDALEPWFQQSHEVYGLYKSLKAT